MRLKKNKKGLIFNYGCENCVDLRTFLFTINPKIHHHHDPAQEKEELTAEEDIHLLKQKNRRSRSGKLSITTQTSRNT